MIDAAGTAGAGTTDPAELLETLVDQAGKVVSAQPVVVGLVVLTVVIRAAVRVHRDVGRARPRDPVRTFPWADKTALLTRAGGRCEHHTRLGGRCPETRRLEADHVHPHSRGGWTAVANGQALCRPHNKAKGPRVPTAGEVRRLVRRREGYFPPGTATEVVRRRPRTATPGDLGAVPDAPGAAVGRVGSAPGAAGGRVGSRTRRVGG